MRKRKKQSRRQRATQQQRKQPIRAHSDRLLRLLPRLGSPIDPPLLVRSRVTVLIRGSWSALNEALQQLAKPDTGSPVLDALDTLVEIGAPILAQRALQNHMREYGTVYQQWQLFAFSFHPPTSQRSAATTWGELSPQDVAPDVERALATATQARAMLPDLPAHIFWPFIGAFFCAPDNSAQISPQTWADINAAPQQHSLLQVLISSHYGSVSRILQDNELPTTHGSEEWRLCFRCGHASQAEEYILWDERQYCPYWCGEEIEWDTELWEQARITNPTLPKEPQRWITYSQEEDS